MSRPLVLGALGLLLPAVAHPAEMLGGSHVVVGPDVVIADDLYVAASTFELQGTIDGDLILLAGDARIEGIVTGDILVAARTVAIATDVSGSVRGAAGTLVVESRVARDAVLAGGDVTLPVSARIGRDLVLAAGEGLVSGSVGRGAMLAGDRVVLDGPVGSSVRAQVADLALTDRAQIGGDLHYASEREAEIADGAVVDGHIERQEPAWAQRSGLERALLAVFGWLRMLIGFWLAGLLLVAVFPGFTRRSETVLTGRPVASLAAGLVAAAGLPLMSALIFVAGMLLGGWWLGFVGFGVLAAGLLGGVLVTGVTVGDWLIRRLGRTVGLAWAMLAGLVALLLVGAVPYLGAVVLALATVLGFGGMALAGVWGRTGAVPV